MSDEQADRGEREARIRERLETSTWAPWDRRLTFHAPEDIAYLLSRVERYREALEQIVDVSMDTLREDPPRLDEIYKIAHRALNEGEDDGERQV